MQYHEFIEQKTHLSGNFGFEPTFMPDMLFDFQKALVEWAVRKGRAAIFADCGMGKTLAQLAWAQNVVERTNKRVLILTPLAVASQTVKEAEKIDIEAHHKRTNWIASDEKIIVTNYEKLHLFDPTDFIGAVCDESSILKHYTGATQKKVTRFLSKLPYRLLCTATAAPNDYVELGTSAEALGELSHSDMLTRFFRQLDDKGQKKAMKEQQEAEKQVKNHFARLSFRVHQSIGQWRLKNHATVDFWKWVTSWARACRMPSDLGFDDGAFILPPLHETSHIIQPSQPPEGWLFTFPAVGLQEEREERKRTLQERVDYACQLVKHDRPAVIWCHLNPEGDLLEKSIPDSRQVAGRTLDDEKEEIYNDFTSGKLRVIIIKPKIGAWGMNWQHCNHVVTFATHCYDAKTELLTAKGWKTFNKVQKGDEVGTINPTSQFFEWQQATGAIWNPYSGDMIKFTGRSYDLVVTPNHRMWSRRNPLRYPTSKGVWGVNTAEELERGWKRQCRDFQSVAAGWIGHGEDEVIIPLNEHVDYSNYRTRRVGSIKSDVFASLAGWYLSEGCVMTRDGIIDGQIVICQTNIHPENRAQIINTLKATGLPVNYDTKDIRICNKELAYFLANELGLRSANMKIPRWIKDWPVERLRILWEAIMNGDGMHNNGKLLGLKSTSHQLIADCQEIGFKIGIATTDRSTEGDYLRIRSEYTTPSLVNRPERVSYNGMIGCVTVPNGLLVVRRNGHIIVSGNSYEQYYQSVRRCWRFGQKSPVQLDIIASEGEKRVIENMKRKSDQAAVMFSELVKYMNNSLTIKKQQVTHNVEVPSWL